MTDFRSDGRGHERGPAGIASRQTGFVRRARPADGPAIGERGEKRGRRACRSARVVCEGSADSETCPPRYAVRSPPRSSGQRVHGLVHGRREQERGEHKRPLRQIASFPHWATVPRATVESGLLESADASDQRHYRTCRRATSSPRFKRRTQAVSRDPSRRARHLARHRRRHRRCRRPWCTPSKRRRASRADGDVEGYGPYVGYEFPARRDRGPRFRLAGRRRHRGRDLHQRWGQERQREFTGRSSPSSCVGGAHGPRLSGLRRQQRHRRALRGAPTKKRALRGLRVPAGAPPTTISFRRCPIVASTSSICAIRTTPRGP